MAGSERSARSAAAIALPPGRRHPEPVRSGRRAFHEVTAGQVVRIRVAGALVLFDGARSQLRVSSPCNSASNSSMAIA